MESEDKLDESDIKIEETEVIYAGKNATEFPNDVLETIKDCDAILHVNLSHNEFTDPTKLSVFKNLVELNLDNNNINEESKFPVLYALETFSLNNNKISKLPKFVKAIANSFKKLAYLGILGNPVCPSITLSNYEEEYGVFRCKLVRNIPTLKFLDWKQVTAQERKSTTLKRFEEYSPLPASNLETKEHIGTAGKVRYTYVGKQSEGNRFIRNKHL